MALKGLWSTYLILAWSWDMVYGSKYMVLWSLKRLLISRSQLSHAESFHLACSFVSWVVDCLVWFVTLLRRQRHQMRKESTANEAIICTGTRYRRKSLDNFL